MLARARALGLFGRLRVARLLPLIFVPLATGCSLWYLATDPFDGLGEGSDGGVANGDGTLEASPDDEASACGDLTDSPNCGACGVTCAGQCVPTTVGGAAVPYHCGAEKVDTTIFGHLLQAIATANDSLYVLDNNGGVYQCDDDCKTFTTLAEAGPSGGACYLAASDRGLYWSQTPVGGTSNVVHIDYDGGARQMLAAVNPQAVAAKGARVVWTSDPSSGECNVFKRVSGVLFFSVSPALGNGSDGGTVAADLRNIAIADDGGSVAATTSNSSKLIIAQLQEEGGIGTPANFGDNSDTNLHIASNGSDVFFTSASAKNTGNLYEWTASGKSVNELAPTMPGLDDGAPIFVDADGTIFWSDTQLTISYCLPPGAGVPCTNVTTLQFAQGSNYKVTIQQIGATSKHIFFTDTSNTLYRVDRL